MGLRSDLTWLFFPNGSHYDDVEMLYDLVKNNVVSYKNKVVSLERKINIKNVDLVGNEGDGHRYKRIQMIKYFEGKNYHCECKAHGADIYAKGVKSIAIECGYLDSASRIINFLKYQDEVWVHPYDGDICIFKRGKNFTKYLNSQERRIKKFFKKRGGKNAG